MNIDLSAIDNAFILNSMKDSLIRNTEYWIERNKNMMDELEMQIMPLVEQAQQGNQYDEKALETLVRKYKFNQKNHAEWLAARQVILSQFGEEKVDDVVKEAAALFGKA